jgi:transcription termination/antitermination protein NusA
MNVMKYMSIFSNITRTNLKDCINLNSRIIFIVDELQVGKAIGKKGANIKKLEKILNNKVMVVGFNNDPLSFIKNLIYPSKVKDITAEGEIYTITPGDSASRSMIIGRSATNLREHESILKRYFPVKEIKVK